MESSILQTSLTWETHLCTTLILNTPKQHQLARQHHVPLKIHMLNFSRVTGMLRQLERFQGRETYSFYSCFFTMFAGTIHQNIRITSSHVEVLVNEYDTILLYGIKNNGKSALNSFVLLWLKRDCIHISFLGSLSNQISYNSACIVVGQGWQRIPQILGIRGGNRYYFAGSSMHHFCVDESFWKEHIQQKWSHIHICPLFPWLPVRPLSSFTARSPCPSSLNN